MPTVGDLILLAAPSCCGKTRFLGELFAGRLNDVLATMKIEAPIDSYESVIPKQIKDINNPHVPGMILHYALPTIDLNEGSLLSLEDDSRLAIVKHAERVTVITLVTSPGILTSRLAARHKAHRVLLLKNLSKYFIERRRLGKLKPLYANPDSIMVAYDALFAYCNSQSNIEDIWVITADDNYEVYSQREWMSIRESYFNESSAD